MIVYFDTVDLMGPKLQEATAYVPHLLTRASAGLMHEFHSVYLT